MQQNQQLGFTLIELMIVVAIISILATLALPRFKVFQVKAFRSEAQVNLKQIYTLQEVYRAENSAYVRIPVVNESSCADTNAIGFKVSNCQKMKYIYLHGPATVSTFTAYAQTSTDDTHPFFANCEESDELQISEKNDLFLTGDSIALCR